MHKVCYSKKKKTDTCGLHVEQVVLCYRHVKFDAALIY